MGGAIAVHFGYHYPKRVERLILVSAGGLGREVHPVLRAAALPGAPLLLAAAMRPRLIRLYARPHLHRALRLTPDNVVNLRRARRALERADRRAAFFAALRGVIAPSGQRGSFIEMKYLAEHVPTLLVWSEGDGVIPVAHAHAARAHLPGSRLRCSREAGTSRIAATRNRSRLRWPNSFCRPIKWEIGPVKWDRA